MSETRGPNSNTVCVSVLFNVLQQGGAGVHHGLEGILAAGGDAFVRVEQDRQLPVRLVHLLPGDTPTETINNQTFSHVTLVDASVPDFL